MEDAIKSIKAYLYDRESSPLTGAYFISWCIWNFKFLLIIFSSDPVRTKFVNIESYIFEPSYFFGHSQWLGPVWVYFIPLTLALLYLVALPKFSRKIYEISLHNRKLLNETKQAIEDQELLTQEESRKIRREIRKIAEKYEEEIKQKDETISELRNGIEKLLNTAKQETPTKHQKIYENLSEDAKKILSMAALDGDGEIIRYDSLDGFSMSAGGKELTPETNREASALKEALNELEIIKLIASKGNKRVIFEVTQLGYEVADLIRPQTE